MKDHDEIKQLIRGPVPSIRTPFTRDGAIDFKGLRAIVDFCIDADATTMLLTFGDSLYSILTDDEVVAASATVMLRI